MPFSSIKDTFSVDVSIDASVSAPCSHVDTSSIARITAPLIVETREDLARTAAGSEGAETRLTAIERKGDTGELLTTEDLAFFDEAGMVARKPEDINEETRVYVGALAPGFFASLPVHLKHIYTSFPEGRIRLESLEVGGMTAEEIIEALEREKVNTSTYSRGMLRNRKQFTDPVNARHREREGSKETFDLVRLRIADLGYDDPQDLPTTRDIFGDSGKRNGRIHELGLELCPPEVGPYKRLKDKDQPLEDWYCVGMDPIADSGGHPYVFGLGRRERGLWLDDYWACPDDRWDLDRVILLRRRKLAA